MNLPKAALFCLAITALQAVCASAAITIVASQDLTVRRGPTKELGLHAKESTNNSTDRYLLIRFDSALFGANVTSATFNLTANADTVTQFQGSFSYQVYGVLESNTVDELFDEAGYVPGDGTVYNGDTDLVDAATLFNLGSTGLVNAGDTVSFSPASLLSFIQSDTNGVVSLAFLRNTSGGNSTFLDRTTATPPQLVIEAVPEPGTFALLGFSALLICRRKRARD